MQAELAVKREKAQGREEGMIFSAGICTRIFAVLGGQTAVWQAASDY